jgi:hypothetical protein
MVCKAYIATSEDPIHGNKIGSAIFCDKLEENYRLLYLGHIEEQSTKGTRKTITIIKKQYPKNAMNVCIANILYLLKLSGKTKIK